jgi:hypothetical protein
MSTLIVLDFDGIHTADEVLNKVRSLQKDAHRFGRSPIRSVQVVRSPLERPSTRRRRCRCASSQELASQ